MSSKTNNYDTTMQMCGDGRKRRGVAMKHEEEALKSCREYKIDGCTKEGRE